MPCACLYCKQQHNKKRKLFHFNPSERGKGSQNLNTGIQVSERVLQYIENNKTCQLQLKNKNKNKRIPWWKFRMLTIAGAL